MHAVVGIFLNASNEIRYCTDIKLQYTSVDHMSRAHNGEWQTQEFP